MPFTNLNLITVTAKYFLLSGSAASGTVTFTPSEVLTDTVANEIIHPSPFTAPISAGTISIQLPATNDPDLSPVGWTYKVQENITGSTASRIYHIALPYDLAGATVDLADIVPVLPIAEFGTYALKTELEAARKVLETIRTGAAYTLALADSYTVVARDHTTTNTTTVPPHSSQPFPVGTVIEVYWLGAGQPSLVAGSGVILEPNTALKVGSQFGSAQLRKRLTDTWQVSGNLVA